MPGIVYLATNPLMPDIVKIGLVERDNPQSLQGRINDFYYGAAGVPVPFDVAYAISVEDPKEIEKLLHNAFADSRVNPKREFFHLDPPTEEKQGTLQQLIILMRGYGTPVDLQNLRQSQSGKKITLDEIQAHDDAELNRRQRSPFRFTYVDISKGETLTFSTDIDITASVVDDRFVDFEGKNMSLSKSAGIIRERQGFSPSVAGTDYWQYKGETLSAMRKRMEECKQS